MTLFAPRVENPAVAGVSYNYSGVAHPATAGGWLYNAYMYFVYVIYNKLAGKFYIGQTQNIEARLEAHNNKHKVKSFTARFEGEWKLIHQESFSTRSEAISRERQLKSHQGREYITQYIPG